MHARDRAFDIGLRDLRPLCLELVRAMGSLLEDLSQRRSSTCEVLLALVKELPGGLNDMLHDTTRGGCVSLELADVLHQEARGPLRIDMHAKSKRDERVGEPFRKSSDHPRQFVESLRKRFLQKTGSQQLEVVAPQRGQHEDTDEPGIISA